MLGWSSAVRTSGPSVRASLPAEPEIYPSTALNLHFSSSTSLPPVDKKATFEPSERAIASIPPVQDMKAQNKAVSSSTKSEAKRSTSPVRPPPVAKSSLPRSISKAIGQSKNGQDSPVMNETLSVIDEHITNLNTPRHSVAANDSRTITDSASEYSNNIDSRLSYVPGPETDEEDEEEMPSEASVKRWSSRETANHLRKIGVDTNHCDIFEEQEISGDVLLEMDQEFIHMKEYNFGVMGRRLKTWHKIRQFQEEVKGTKFTREHSPSYASATSGTTDGLESRIGSSGSTLPQIPSVTEISESSNSRQLHHSIPYADAHKEHIPAPLQTQSNRASGSRSNIKKESPRSPWRISVQDSPSRPSAASVREMSHSRRHSSLDIGLSPTFETKPKTGSLSGKFSSHKKQASFDRSWSMASTVPTLHSHPDMAGAPFAVSLKGNLGSSGQSISQSSADLDRGYFSGPESDASKPRKFLRKRDGTGSASHSRHSSFVDQPNRDLIAKNRHSRFGSADSLRDIVPAVTSPAAQAYHSKSFKSRFRSASARTASGTSPIASASPTVTNLEGGQSPSVPTPSPRPESDVSGTSSPLPPMSGKSSVRQKRFGLRAISDAVTGNEKALVSSPTSIPSSFKDSPLHSPSRTGSSTPSATSRSLDIDNADASSKGTDALGQIGPPRMPARGKPKTKKDTSAYTKGLEKRSPAEQRLVCDYSGWMKKKSSSLITTWKPRLFFLRGRRLSYYYSESDTEERGVIDISSHKVLRADSDPITTLHATITGSTSTPMVQSPPAISNNAGASNGWGKPASAGAPFIFKLIPPKAGLSRAVQFTKPTIHYFQVDSVHEGRKWMAALMKATIDYDPSFGLETTNKQKTISLVKARARKERPPALMGDEPAEKVPEGPKSDETGLNIRGLSFDDLQNNETRPNGTDAKHKKGGSKETGRSTSRTRAASEAATHRNADRLH
jgi:PH domain/SAM domain (Sterile alpha motif)